MLDYILSDKKSFFIKHELRNESCDYEIQHPLPLFCWAEWPWLLFWLCVCSHVLSFSSKSGDTFFSIPVEMIIEAKYGLVCRSALLRAEAGFEERWRPLTFGSVLADGSCWLEHSVVLRRYWPQVAWDCIVLRKWQTYSLFPDLRQIEPKQLPRCR